MALEGCGSCRTVEALADICGSGFSRIKTFGIAPMYDAQFNRIFIDTASLTLGADVQGYADMTDPDFQLFMLPLANVVTPARADANFVTDDDGENFDLETGEKVSFIFEFWNAAPRMAEAVRAFKCKAFQVFLFDVDGNIIGSEYIDGDHTKLYGWAVNPDSLVSRYIIATAAAQSMVRIAFDLIQVLEKASTYKIITPEQLGYNPLTTLLPAKHLDAVATVVDADTLTVVLRAPALSSGQYMYGRGLTVANGAVWKVVNETAGTTQTLLSAAVVFANVDDPEPGNEPTYTLTITPATAGDILHVEVVVAKYLVQPSNKVTAV